MNHDHPPEHVREIRILAEQHWDLATDAYRTDSRPYRCYAIAHEAYIEGFCEALRLVHNALHKGKPLLGSEYAADCYIVSGALHHFRCYGEAAEVAYVAGYEHATAVTARLAAHFHDKPF